MRKSIKDFIANLAMEAKSALTRSHKALHKAVHKAPSNAGHF